MRALDNRLNAVVVTGLLSSAVLLAASAQPPSVTVSELWGLGEDVSLTVSGVLVSLRAYESGAEVIVMSDLSGDPTVKVVCSVGPGRPPSEFVSIGDLLGVSGDCVFEGGVPVVYCEYAGVSMIRPAEEVLTVALLSVAWHLFEGDRITIGGVSELDASGAARLWDPDGGCSIGMRLPDTAPVVGFVIVDCTLVLDRATMALVLEVDTLAPRP
jgi:hypothetical protein